MVDKRYFFQCEFIGDGFAGSQYQPNQRTVQGELIKAFMVLWGEGIEVHMSSRVDAGVHARGMIGHVVVSSQMIRASMLDDLELNKKNILINLNGILPKDIVVSDIYLVSGDAHSRYQAISRTYQYRLSTSIIRSPFWGEWIEYYHHVELDLDGLNNLSQVLVGIHDCIGLASPRLSQMTSTCSISEAFWTQVDPEVYIFQITANRFLYKMVRNIVGILIAIQKKKISSTALADALLTKDNQYSKYTAKPKGLCLMKVRY